MEPFISLGLKSGAHIIAAEFYRRLDEVVGHSEHSRLVAG
jgi:hypothetical protein